MTDHLSPGAFLAAVKFDEKGLVPAIAQPWWARRRAKKPAL